MYSQILKYLSFVFDCCLILAALAISCFFCNPRDQPPMKMEVEKIGLTQ